MGGWLNQLLIQEGVAFTASLPVINPLVLPAISDTSTPLKVSAHSATQSVDIADFASFGDLPTHIGLVTIHGDGIPGQGPGNSDILLYLETAGTARCLSVANRTAPAGANAQLLAQVDGSSEWLFNNGTTLGVMAFSAAGNFSLDCLAGAVILQDKVQIAKGNVGAGQLGFFSTAPVVIQTVTGAKVDPVAASILAALAAYGIVIDSTT